MAEPENNQMAFWETMKEKYVRRNESLKHREECLRRRLEQLKQILEKQKAGDDCDCVPEKLEKPSLVQCLVEKGKSLIMGSCKCEDPKLGEELLCACHIQDSKASLNVIPDLCALQEPTAPEGCLNPTCDFYDPALAHMAEDPSTFSLKTTDIYYMDKLADLVKSEKNMRDKIDDLERRERSYLVDIHDMQEMMKKQTRTEPINREFKKLTEGLQQENKKLRNEIEDIRLELKHCFERVEGPLRRSLENQQAKCSNLENQLEDLKTKTKFKEDSYLREINEVKAKLCQTCCTMVDLNSVNSKLKADLDSIQIKCSNLEEELLKQQIREAENILKFKNVLSRRTKNRIQHENDDSDQDLGHIAKKLGDSLKEVCPCVSDVPSGLTETAENIRQLTELVGEKGQQHRKKRKGKISEIDTSSCSGESVIRAPDTFKMSQIKKDADECACSNSSLRLKPTIGKYIGSSSSVSLTTKPRHKTKVAKQTCTLRSRIVEKKTVSKGCTCCPAQNESDHRQWNTPRKYNETRSYSLDFHTKKTGPSGELIVLKNLDRLSKPAERTLIQDKAPLSSEIPKIKPRRNKLAVDTKCEVLDESPKDIHVVTTLANTGSLEITTEGPPGIIETKVNYLPDGKVEIVTKLMNHHNMENFLDTLLFIPESAPDDGNSRTNGGQLDADKVPSESGCPEMDCNQSKTCEGQCDNVVEENVDETDNIQPNFMNKSEMAKDEMVDNTLPYAPVMVNDNIIFSVDVNTFMSREWKNMKLEDDNKEQTALQDIDLMVNPKGKRQESIDVHTDVTIDEEIFRFPSTQTSTNVEDNIIIASTSLVFPDALDTISEGDEQSDSNSCDKLSDVEEGNTQGREILENSSEESSSAQAEVPVVVHEIGNTPEAFILIDRVDIIENKSKEDLHKVRSKDQHIGRIVTGPGASILVEKEEVIENKSTESLHIVRSKAEDIGRTSTGPEASILFEKEDVIENKSTGSLHIVRSKDEDIGRTATGPEDSILVEKEDVIENKSTGSLHIVRSKDEDIGRTAARPEASILVEKEDVNENKLRALDIVRSKNEIIGRTTTRPEASILVVKEDVDENKSRESLHIVRSNDEDIRRTATRPEAPILVEKEGVNENKLRALDIVRSKNEHIGRTSTRTDVVKDFNLLQPMMHLIKNCSYLNLPEELPLKTEIPFRGSLTRFRSANYSEWHIGESFFKMSQNNNTVNGKITLKHSKSMYEEGEMSGSDYLRICKSANFLMGSLKIDLENLKFWQKTPNFGDSHQPRLDAREMFVLETIQPGPDPVNEGNGSSCLGTDRNIASHILKEGCNSFETYQSITKQIYQCFLCSCSNKKNNNDDQQEKNLQSSRNNEDIVDRIDRLLEIDPLGEYQGIDRLLYNAPWDNGKVSLGECKCSRKQSNKAKNSCSDEENFIPILKAPKQPGGKVQHDENCNCVDCICNPCHFKKAIVPCDCTKCDCDPCCAKNNYPSSIASSEMNKQIQKITVSIPCDCRGKCLCNPCMDASRNYKHPTRQPPQSNPQSQVKSNQEESAQEASCEHKFPDAQPEQSKSAEITVGSSRIKKDSQTGSPDITLRSPRKKVVGCPCSLPSDDKRTLCDGRPYGYKPCSYEDKARIPFACKPPEKETKAYGPLGKGMCDNNCCDSSVCETKIDVSKTCNLHPCMIHCNCQLCECLFCSDQNAKKKSAAKPSTVQGEYIIETEDPNTPSSFQPEAYLRAKSMFDPCVALVEQTCHDDVPKYDSDQCECKLDFDPNDLVAKRLKVLHSDDTPETKYPNTGDKSDEKAMKQTFRSEKDEQLKCPCSMKPNINEPIECDDCFICCGAVIRDTLLDNVVEKGHKIPRDYCQPCSCYPYPDIQRDNKESQMIADADITKKEIKSVLNKISCSCDQAEHNLKPLVKQASNFETTMSRMKMKLNNLQLKCKDKDQIIDAMTNELRMRSESGVFEDFLHDLAHPKDRFTPDYTRTYVCDFLPKPRHKARNKQQQKGSRLCHCNNNTLEPILELDRYLLGSEHDTYGYTKNLDVSGMEIIDIRRVTIDSILIKWRGPTCMNGVTGYQIFVNDELKYRVLSPNRTNAVIDTLDLCSSLEIMLFAITTYGRCEPPALATYKI